MGDAWWIVDSGWWVLGGGWWVVGGGWWVVGGGWWVEPDYQHKEDRGDRLAAARLTGGAVRRPACSPLLATLHPVTRQTSLH